MKAAIGTGQLLRFAREIAVGDIVFVPNGGSRKVHIGRVSGGFEYVDNPTDGCPYRQRRPVEWIKDVPRSTLPQPLLNTLGALTTIFSLHRRRAFAEAVVDGTEMPTPGVAAGSEDVVEHVLRRLHAMHPKEFEDFVSSYFSVIGYDSEPTPYVGDGGIDVAGTLNAEGLAQVLLRVQVKRTRSNVGIDTVLKTRGALAVDEQGAIISLGGFTSAAAKEAEAAGKRSIVLVDGETFVEMVLERWEDLDLEVKELLGVQPREQLQVRDRFEVRRPDDDS
jgi:predicted Mrr-cat superfamily restriction endonuclease